MRAFYIRALCTRASTEDHATAKTSARGPSSSERPRFPSRSSSQEASARALEERVRAEVEEAEARRQELHAEAMRRHEEVSAASCFVFFWKNQNAVGESTCRVFTWFG